MCDVTLQMGSSLILSGPSSCGKSTFVTNLIKSRNTMFDRKIENVYVVCSNIQTMYNDLFKSGHIRELFYEMPSRNEILELAYINKLKGGAILILDDLLTEISKSNLVIQELFTEIAHHNDLTVVLCVQNLFYKGGIYRTLSLNASYIIPFKHPRDEVNKNDNVDGMFIKRLGDLFFLFLATNQSYGISKFCEKSKIFN